MTEHLPYDWTRDTQSDLFLLNQDLEVLVPLLHSDRETVGPNCSNLPKILHHCKTSPKVSWYYGLRVRIKKPFAKAGLLIKIKGF